MGEMQVSMTPAIGTVTQAAKTDIAAKQTTENKVDTKDGKTKYDAGAAALYEKTSELISNKKDPYSINKKSASERAEIVARMKAAEEDRANSLTEMVRRMISGQADADKKANNSPFFSGSASAEAIRKAKEDISEVGYYGVKQTSQRLFDFASALAGDDVEKMQKMQKAMNKGIGQAASKLGGLPSICKETQEAANKLFDEYYESKGIKTDERR